MKEKPPLKERFRNYTLKCSQPLSSSIIEDLPKNRDFFPKYQNIEPILVGNRIMSIMVRDSFNINYQITPVEIRAGSPVQPDERVIEKLKLMGERICEIYNLEADTFIFVKGADFRFIENFDLHDAIKNGELIGKLETALSDTGKLTLSTMKFVFVKDEPTEEGPIVNLRYANCDDFKNKRVLIEGNEEFVEKVANTLRAQ